MVRAVRALRLALTIAPFAAAVFVVGSGLAASPYAENDPCVPAGELLDSRLSVQLVPYGTRCERETAGGGLAVQELAPSTGVLVAWLNATAIGLACLLRLRHHPAARGAALAAVVLAVFGLGYHRFAEWAPVGFATMLYGAPLIAWIDRLLRSEPRWLASIVLGVSLPFTVIFAWSFPYFLGAHAVGVVTGMAAGAGLAVAIEQLPAMSGRSSRASRPRPG